MLDAQLRQRPADLGRMAAVDLATGFRRVKIVRALTPFCLSSGNSGGVDLSATLRDEREDLSGEVTLQGSNGVEFGMPFCDPTSNIVLGFLVGP